MGKAVRWVWEMECSVSSSAEQGEVEGRRGDPVAIAAPECDGNAILSDVGQRNHDESCGQCCEHGLHATLAGRAG